MNLAHYFDLLSRFEESRVLVVGDIFLDEITHCVLIGRSLEAPVPTYSVDKRTYNPGAAGNVACNLVAMGARTAIVGLVGDDINGRIVRDELAARDVDISGVVVEPDYTTNTYGKVKASGVIRNSTQEILRLDATTSKSFFKMEVEGRLIANIVTRANDVDAIIVIDQAVSTIKQKTIEAIASCGARNNLLTVADSRERLGLFAGFDVAVPNFVEAGEADDILVTDEATV